MAYFQTKIPIRVNFGGPWNVKVWYLKWPFDTFYGHLVICVVASWYILPRFGICVKKNLATLVSVENIVCTIFCPTKLFVPT
jgi:hypothetical protein